MLQDFERIWPVFTECQQHCRFHTLNGCGVRPALQGHIASHILMINILCCSRKTFLRTVCDITGFAPWMAVVCARLYKVRCSLTHPHTSTLRHPHIQLAALQRCCKTLKDFDLFLQNVSNIAGFTPWIAVVCARLYKVILLHTFWWSTFYAVVENFCGLFAT